MRRIAVSVLSITLCCLPVAAKTKCEPPRCIDKSAVVWNVLPPSLAKDGTSFSAYYGCRASGVINAFTYDLETSKSTYRVLDAEQVRAVTRRAPSLKSCTDNCRKYVYLARVQGSGKSHWYAPMYWENGATTDLSAIGLAKTIDEESRAGHPPYADVVLSEDASTAMYTMDASYYVIRMTGGGHHLISYPDDEVVCPSD